MKRIVFLFLTSAIVILSGFNVVQAKKTKFNDSLELSVTRCFRSSRLHVKCEDFSVIENKMKKLVQELQIEGVDYYGTKRSYGYGKAIEGQLCKRHLVRILSLLKDSTQVCVTGDDEVIIGPDETFSRWRAFETQNGNLTW